MAKTPKVEKRTSIERKVTISYNWSRTDDKEIPTEHLEALEESAMERVVEMMDEGYTSGELHDTVRMNDEDGEDGIEYSGHWGMNTEVVR